MAPTIPNHPLHVPFKIMHNVLESSKEEKIGAIFNKFRQDAYMCNILLEMVHLQPSKTTITEILYTQRILKKAKHCKYISIRI